MGLAVLVGIAGVDGREVGRLTAKQLLTVAVAPGEHLLTAASAEAEVTWRQAEEEKLRAAGWVRITAGSFEMGCVPADSECDQDEEPRHPVTLKRDFWLMKTEVTVAQYKRFVTATGRGMPGAPSFNPGWNAEDHPIVNVTWNEASGFCEWVGGRLPTEAEWEYAARGGEDGLTYPWGDSLSHDQANFSGTGGRDQWSATSPVGSFAPTAWRLSDMAGNVWEWVSDRYGPYTAARLTDPTGPASGIRRVLRGGSWNNKPRNLRVSGRLRSLPGHENGTGGGLRCARAANP